MLERISRLIKSKKLSSSQFADEFGVQRSSVSHVLSGRNKPSLDFVTKILDAYDDINPDWLLNGKGNMFRVEEASSSGVLPFEDTLPDEPDEVPGQDEIEAEPPQIKRQVKKEAGNKRKVTGQKSVTKIVLFYEDGTFREFSPDEY